MARMSVDDSALRDPRVLRLARAVGWSRRETLGALLDVWAIAYDRAVAVIPEEDLDIAAERDGFARAMEVVGLAVAEPEGFRLRGAEERIHYLTEQAERGRKGGLTRAANERAKREAANEPQAYASSTAQASFKPPDPVPDPASPPDPAPDLPSPSLPAGEGDRVRGRKRPKPGEPTPAEHAMALRVLAKLGERNGVAYQGAQEHLRLIVARHRERAVAHRGDAGAAEMDLRYVVGYCAKRLRWDTDAERAIFLRPETLFGPKTIQRYLDPALAWVRDLPNERRPAAVIAPATPAADDDAANVLTLFPEAANDA